MFALKLVKNFAKIKPLKIVAASTEKGMKVTSLTDKCEF